MAPDPIYRESPPLTNTELDALFSLSWPNYTPRDFLPVLARSLTFVCAYEADQLIGFVNLAWDGGHHTFILDVTVRPDWRRQGVGRQLIQRAVAIARAQGVEWVHVDFEPSLTSFYAQCGFQPTAAGLIRVGKGR